MVLKTHIPIRLQFLKDAGDHFPRGPHFVGDLPVAHHEGILSQGRRFLADVGQDAFIQPLEQQPVDGVEQFRVPLVVQLQEAGVPVGIGGQPRGEVVGRKKPAFGVDFRDRIDLAHATPHAGRERHDAAFARLDVIQEQLTVFVAGEDLDESVFDDRNHGNGISGREQNRLLSDQFMDAEGSERG